MPHYHLLKASDISLSFIGRLIFMKILLRFIGGYFANCFLKWAHFFHALCNIMYFQVHIPECPIYILDCWAYFRLFVGTFAYFLFKLLSQRILLIPHVSHSGIILITFSFGNFNSFFIAFFYLVVYFFLLSLFLHPYNP